MPTDTMPTDTEAAVDSLTLAFGSQPHRTIRFSKKGASLGLKASTTDELIDQVEHGFSFKTITALESHSGVSAAAIASAIGIPERTFARRKASGRLAPDESERLLRLSTVFEQAVELFEGDVHAAMNWLMTPKRALGGRTPFSYSRTELGARKVEGLIGRLEHGVFS